MNTATEYNQPIETIHADAERLDQLVASGIYPQSLLDAYLTSARRRTDWTEPA